MPNMLGKDALEYLIGNLRQITILAKQFNDSVIMDSEENQGFGRVVHKVLLWLERDSLWIEDDWLWTKPFRLANVESNTKDKWFAFVRSILRLYKSPLQ